MQMAGKLSVNMLICERVLVEADGVMSAIRIVEAFNIGPQIPDMLPLEKSAASLWLWSTIKFEFHDEYEHAIEARIIRPDGEATTVGEPSKFTLRPPQSALDPGIVFAFPVNVLLKQMGLHYMAIVLDQVEIGRTPFIIQKIG
jgi:hypothetical protein